MQIYLLRHGIAEVGKPGSPDSERALTPDGKRKLREVLRVVKTAGVTPTLMITSPYRRAVETAAAAAEVLGYKEAVLRTKALVPDAAPAEVWDEIRAHKGSEQVVLVSHEPLLGHLTGYLLGSPSLQVDFKKSALIRIDAEHFGAHPRGILRWFLTPRLAAVE